MPVKQLWRPQSAGDSSDEYYTEPVGSYTADPGGGRGRGMAKTAMYASTPSVWKSRDDHMYESAPNLKKAKGTASRTELMTFGSSVILSKEHIYESLSDIRRDKLKLQQQQQQVKLRNKLGREDRAASRLKRLSLDVTRQMANGIVSLAKQVANAKTKEEEEDIKPVISSPISVVRRTPAVLLPKFHSEQPHSDAVQCSEVATIVRREEWPKITPPECSQPREQPLTFQSPSRLAPLPEEACHSDGKMMMLRRREEHRRSVASFANNYYSNCYNSLSPDLHHARKRLNFDDNRKWPELQMRDKRRSVAVMEMGGGEVKGEEGPLNLPPNGCE